MGLYTACMFTQPHTGLACILHRFESVSVVSCVCRYSWNDAVLMEERGKKDRIGKALTLCEWALNVKSACHTLTAQMAPRRTQSGRRLADPAHRRIIVGSSEPNCSAEPEWGAWPQSSMVKLALCWITCSQPVEVAEILTPQSRSLVWGCSNPARLLLGSAFVQERLFQQQL